MNHVEGPAGSKWIGAKELQKYVRPISGLRHDPKNARQHEERSIAALIGSLRRFGQQKPVVVSGGVVVAGNGMMEAAKRLGWKGLACVEISDAEKARVFALLDNRTAELSKWDAVMLRAAMGELDDELVDLLRLSDIGAVKAEGAADFLDGWIKEGKSGDSEESAKPTATEGSDEWMTWGCMLTASENELVYAAIRLAKQRGAKTSGEALYEIANDFLGGVK